VNSYLGIIEENTIHNSVTIHIVDNLDDSMAMNIRIDKSNDSFAMDISLVGTSEIYLNTNVSDEPKTCFSFEC